MSGTIAFLVNEIFVNETAGQAVLTIARTGDLSQPTTINYAVTADTATAGSDFQPRSGSVTMAAGQNRAFVNVPIINDGLSEATETFIGSITGVSSGTFGTPRTTRVNILDDENPVGEPPNPPLVSDYIVTEQRMMSGLNQPIDFVFSPTDPDILYIAEKGGRIRVYDLAEDRFLPDFIDLSAKVNDWEDRGLLNIELHPDFPNQPYLYAYYVVDPAEAAGYDRPGRARRQRQPVRLSLALHGRPGERPEGGSGLGDRAGRWRRDQLHRRRRRRARSRPTDRQSPSARLGPLHRAGRPDAPGRHRRLQAELHQGRLADARRRRNRIRTGRDALPRHRRRRAADPRRSAYGERPGPRQPGGQAPAHQPDHRRGPFEQPLLRTRNGAHVEPGQGLADRPAQSVLDGLQRRRQAVHHRHRLAQLRGDQPGRRGSELRLAVLRGRRSRRAC